MHPILFKIGFVCVYSYGTAVAAAFIIVLYLALRAARQTDVPQDIVVNLALMVLFFGLIGGRLLYVLLNIRDYIESPLEILMFHHGGLAFYGGAITSALAAIIYLRLNKLSAYKLGDLIIPYVALGQAIGRIGCFLNGCCFGKPTYVSIGMMFGGHMEPLHPAQIYSSLALIFLYGFLRLLQKIKVKEGIVLLSYGLLYSAGRFFMEFLRGDNTVWLLGLAFSQFVSIIVFIVCVFLLSRRLRRLYG